MIPVGPPEIDFSLSGQGPTIGGEITLQDVQKGACQRGFVKEGVPPDAPAAKRANVAGFFRILGVNSLTGFKKRFYAEHLPEPHPGMKPLIAEKDKPKEEVITWDVPPMSEYETLKDEYEGLKWRLIPKPGGAVMRPAAWYELWAATQQAAKGDQTSDKPMWAERGGLDFDGRERWEAWEKLKGLDPPDAKKKFLAAYGKAMSADRKKMNFREY